MATGSVHKSSDLVKDYDCGACEEKHFEKSAEFFCNTCLKLFCGECINLHNQLYEKHVSFGRGDMNKWPLSKKTEDFLQICQVHKGEKLKMFCQGHSQLCCTSCVLLSHRQCKAVTLISETGTRLSTDLQQFAVKIETAIKELKQLQSTREGNINYVDYSFSELLQEVRDVRQKLNASLDELEKVTIKELEDARTAMKDSLKIDVDNCIRLKDELKQLTEAVQELDDKKNKEELSFIAGRKCMDKAQESEKFLKRNCVNIECSIMFQTNTDLEHFLVKQLSLGKIVKGRQSMAFQLNPDKVITLKGKSEHDIHISSDLTQTGMITGICCLPSGQIVIADELNMRVKLLDQQYNVVSDCTVYGFPRDICHITCNKVAVTVRDHQTRSVQFISVSNRKLVNKRKFPLQHDVLGISHHQVVLYVTSRTALYHYSLNGTLVKKIYEDVSGADTVCKCAVSPTGDRIYVTQKKYHRLLTLSPDGTLLSAFTDTSLHNPHVCVTPAGQVLVSGLDTTMQVDREGRRKLATFATEADSMRSPTSVCYNINRNTIIVGMWNTLTSKILVIKVK